VHLEQAANDIKHADAVRRFGYSFAFIVNERSE